MARIARFYKHESMVNVHLVAKDQDGCGEYWIDWKKEKATFNDIDLLSDVTKQIEGHTICAFGEGSAWPVQDYRHFKKEIESRCREEPLIKKKINNPYLVDQHLLENKMPKITINGKVEFEKGMTVLQACKLILKYPGFVIMKNYQSQAIVECVLWRWKNLLNQLRHVLCQTTDGMNIKTNTDLVEKVRKGVMEFLLANHPLDCHCLRSRRE